MRFEHRRLRCTSEPITFVMVDGSRHQLAAGQWVEIEQDGQGRFLRIVESGALPPDESTDESNTASHTQKEST